jgi:hypothetical protein
MRNGGILRGRAGRAAVLVAAGLASAGLLACAKKVTTVDPGFTAPEGAPSNQAGLAVWREIPNRFYIFQRGRPCTGTPPTPHVLLDSVKIVTSLPGQLHGVIRDSTPSNSYQVFRREPNGGYRELFDFTAVAARRWFDRGWEIYHFTDADSAVPTHTYVGRGVVGGAAALGSPLTNEGQDLVREIPNITYTGKTGIDVCGCVSPLDSLFLMEWKAVPNAAGYYIHVYQWSFNLIHVDEQIASGMPAPLFIGKSRDILVAYMLAPSPPGATVSFRMPAPGARPPEARVMTVRETRYGQEYFVRIAAVDAIGQLIAYTYGSFGQRLSELPDGTQLPTSQFAVYPLGAVKVVPSRPPVGTPPPCSPSD